MSYLTIAKKAVAGINVPPIDGYIEGELSEKSEIRWKDPASSALSNCELSELSEVTPAPWSAAPLDAEDRDFLYLGGISGANHVQRTFTALWAATDSGAPVEQLIADFRLAFTQFRAWHRWALDLAPEMAGGMVNTLRAQLQALRPDVGTWPQN